MDIEFKAEITAMAHRLIKAGWLASFFWGESGIAAVFATTGLGKANLNLLDSQLKQKGIVNLADLDVTKIKILHELGSLTNEDLLALSYLVSMQREAQQEAQK